MRDTLWICNDGRGVYVREMTRTHIENCIAKIKRDGWRKNWLKRLELELQIRDLTGYKF